MDNKSFILKEILYLRKDLSSLSPETLEALYDSMKELNYKYSSIQEGMIKEKNRIAIISHTIKKLKNLE